MFKIQTFSQYVRVIHKNARIKYGLTWDEVRAELPEHNYRIEWRDYAITSYRNGGEFSPQHWSSLDDGLKYRIQRTTRNI